MPIDRNLIRQVRALDEYDLRRLLIFIRGLMSQPTGEGDDSSASSKVGKVSYRLETVRCGKTGCTRCPHGPYWYAYWREDGRVRSRYIGRKRPDEKA